MSLSSHTNRAAAAACAVLVALGLAACGNTVSTSSFKGEQHAVAQAIANLQSDATSGDHKKICTKDLAGPVVDRLGGVKACERAIKNQVAEIDNLEVKVRSVTTGAGGKTATARVKSTFGGKTRERTVALVKEGGRWKVLRLQ